MNGADVAGVGGPSANAPCPSVESPLSNLGDTGTAGSQAAAALALAERGFHVFPIFWVTDKGCACGDPSCKKNAGKHPVGGLATHGLLDATADLVRVRHWWRRAPRANIGIACEPSNLVVIDVDPRHGGDESLEKLLKATGDTRADGSAPFGAAVVATGGGGFHLYFQADGLRITSRPLPGYPGIDIKAAGGYVVAPGSIHASGEAYRWHISSTPGPMPPALLAILQVEGRAPCDASASRTFGSACIEEGVRNVALTALAGRLRRDGLSETEMGVALVQANLERCNPPLEEREVRTIAHSVARYPSAAEQPDRPPEPPACSWMRAVDAIATPPPATVADGIAWAGCVTLLVGESAAGKTFLLLDLAAAISSDEAWHGRRVRHGSVVYIGFEGHVGLRLQALRDIGDRSLEHIYTVRAANPLSPCLDRERLELPSRGEEEVAGALAEIDAFIDREGLPPVTLVVIDTVRASLAGSEDSSETVSAYLRAVRRLMARKRDVACILAHHAGWQNGQSERKRERGSSAFRGNVDGTLYLEAGEYNRERGEAALTLNTLKARDGEPPPPLHLIRRRVQLPGLADSWGGPVTSCLIESDTRDPAERDAQRAAAAVAQQRPLDLRVLRVLHEHPDATSLVTIRAYAGLAAGRVGDALKRVIGAGWVIPPAQQRQPYRLSEAGVAALGEDS